MVTLKCGIEIHQRLATSRKLFCGCRPDVENSEITGKIRRRLVAVSGELGIVDPAASFEASREKDYQYLLGRDSACLVEADEEPPHEINMDALETVLSVCKSLGSRIVDEVHVMRKTVVDGSAVSGFQRTALVGIGGSIETSFGNVGILTVCLEEESSGIIGTEGNTVTYRLDRLGIPLIEIATAPDIKSGSQAREVAEKIGMLLRSTGKVQRGIGTIRQDINVSIDGGNRVEIKGAQELEMISALVENEAKRQSALGEIAKKAPNGSKDLGKESVTFEDLTNIFSKTKAGGFIEKAIARGESAIAVKLEGFAGLPGTELVPDHRFGTELSQYAKAAAGVGGIIHSDEALLEKYGLAKESQDEIAKRLGCKKADAWVACIVPAHTARKALEAVLLRASRIAEGTLKETRRAASDRTEYMRPLPGSARMYPETDVPPVPITNEMVSNLKQAEGFEEKVSRYSSLGLNAELAQSMAKDYSEIFDEFIETKADPIFTASTLAQTITALRRKGSDTSKLSPAALSEFFFAFAKDRFTKSAATPILEAMSTGKGIDEVLKSGFSRLSKKEVAKVVADYRKTHPKESAQQAFAELMRELRNTIDASDLSDALK